MRVYHFLSAKHALENISKGRIKIAQFQDLNDPFELLGPDLSDKPMRRVFIEFKDDIAQRFGTLCFSRTKKNPVLWSHYADKHRGGCLGFDMPDDRLREVKYTSNRLEFKSKKDLTDGKVLEFLSTKYKGWAYEEEIRCFFSLEEADEETGLYFAAFGDDLKLKEVIVGLGCEIKEREITDRLLGYPESVRVTKARLAFESFEVIEDKEGFRGTDMNESTPSQVHCSHCQTPLSNDHVGPCPECGKTGKTVSVRMAAGMELAGSISWETRRKYYEKNPWVLAGVIAITVGSSVIGLVMGGPLGVVVGLVLGAISFAIGPWAATRIIEIQRGP